MMDCLLLSSTEGVVLIEKLNIKFIKMNELCIALEVKKSNNLLMCPSNIIGKTLSVVDAVVYSV